MLQATLDDAVSQQPSPRTLQTLCEHCSKKQMASKEAQQRCDRVFLSLYTKRYPIPHEMAVVVSVGKTAFTALVPRLGCEAMLYLEEHKDILTWTTNAERADGEERKIFLHAKGGSGSWKNLKVRVFTKLRVTILCKEKAPVDVKLRFEGPWGDEE